MDECVQNDALLQHFDQHASDQSYIVSRTLPHLKVCAGEMCLFLANIRTYNVQGTLTGSSK